MNQVEMYMLHHWRELEAIESVGHRKLRRKALEGYYSSPKYCIQCQEIIQVTMKQRVSETRRKKFCNHSCAASFNNRGKPHGPKRTKDHENGCLLCGNDLHTGQYKYCSLNCFHQHRRILWKHKIESLGYIPTMANDTGTRRSARRYLLMIQGYKCSLCGLETWQEESIPLVVDHIDGNPSNNKLDNLRMICPNCDALLPTYTGRNYGKGRRSRGLEDRTGKPSSFN